MRFQCLLLATLSFYLLAGFSHAFVGPTCMKMKDALGHRPKGISENFEKIVCGKGCKPVISHYDKWVKDKAIHPAIEEVMKEMGSEDKSGIIKKLAVDVFRVIKKECAKDIGKGHLCQDSGTLTKFGNCFKANLMPVFMSKVDKLMPLVTEDMCKKEYDYLKQPKLWKKVIPKYMDAYAKVCKKL